VTEFETRIDFFCNVLVNLVLEFADRLIISMFLFVKLEGTTVGINTYHLKIKPMKVFVFDVITTFFYYLSSLGSNHCRYNPAIECASLRREYTKRRISTQFQSQLFCVQYLFFLASRVFHFGFHNRSLIKEHSHVLRDNASVSVWYFHVLINVFINPIVM
jgi:hypothetical protein